MQNKYSKWLRGHPYIRMVLFPMIYVRRFFIGKRQEKYQSMRHELFKHVTGGSLTFTLADFHGEFSIDARSDLSHRILFEGEYEPEFASLCIKNIDANRDAIDVGANVGLFSVLIAKHLNQGKRVLSIEPTNGAFESLVTNVSRNGVEDKVVLRQVVATEKEGDQTINVCVGREEYSSCGPITHKSAKNANVTQITIPGITLDSLCDEYNLAPGFIKIDTEGWEKQVLFGSENLLRKHRPVILSEISEPLLEACGSSSKEIFDWLESIGYSVFDADYPSKQASSPFVGEILAVPDGKGIKHHE